MLNNAGKARGSMHTWVGNFFKEYLIQKQVRLCQKTTWARRRANKRGGENIGEASESLEMEPGDKTETQSDNASNW